MPPGASQAACPLAIGLQPCAGSGAEAQVSRSWPRCKSTTLEWVSGTGDTHEYSSRSGMYRTHRRAFDRFVLAGLMLTPACASHTAPALPPDAPAPLTIPVVDTTPERTRNLASHNVSPRQLASRNLAPRNLAPRSRLDSAALESAMTQRLAHRPLAEALARRSGNPEMADRAAEAVVHEAG